MPQLTDQELSQIREEELANQIGSFIRDALFERHPSESKITEGIILLVNNYLTKERTKVKEVVAGANNLITHLRKREQDWNTMHYIEKLEYLISNYQNKQQ